MSRLPAWVLVLAVWAAVYLPGLGTFEIKGEEGRRILPAMAMLASGNYLIPQVGSDIYFSKPPLVNWLIAASFRLLGRSEWSARLPSVAAILAVAMAFITIGRVGLGRRGSSIAALVWLTTFGLIEKGRLIEIEALYVSLVALAVICWLSWWLGKASPWLTWTVPWLWLGLGWLAKGPVHLIFFYAVVLGVLCQFRQLKQLLHPAHFLGLLVMLGMFAAWAVPFLEASGQWRGLTKWTAQFTGRASPHLFSAAATLSTIGRAAGQFFPWILFVPLVRVSKLAEPEDRAVAKGLSWAFGLPVMLVSLVPVSSPRYSLPAAAAFAWLVSLPLDRNAFASLPWISNRYRTLWQRLGLPLAIIIAAVCLPGFLILARLPNKRERIRSVAAEVNSRVAHSETLYAVDPGYQPFLFYVHAPVKYLASLDQLPGAAHFFFVRANREAEVSQSELLQRRKVALVLRLRDYRGETILLYQLTEAEG